MSPPGHWLKLGCALRIKRKNEEKKTRRLYCMEWHNTVFAQSGPLSVHNLFTSCIRRCLVSSDCDWVMSALSAVLLIFSYQFSLLFFHILVARQHQHCGVLLVLNFNTQYQISEWDVAENLGMHVSCTERTSEGKTEDWNDSNGENGN